MSKTYAETTENAELYTDYDDAVVASVDAEAETGYEFRVVSVAGGDVVDVAYVLEVLDEEGDRIGFWPKTDEK